MTTELSHICPKYERAAKLLGKPWTSLILRVLTNGPMGFSSIGKSVAKLSDRVLSERLKELEQHGVIERRVYASTPVRIEYRLTDKGHDLQPVLEALQSWADRWELSEVVCEEEATTANT